MKKKLLPLVPALVLAVPLLAQNREAGRVQNAGMVMREILNAPDSIPQSVLDRADCVAILPSVLKFAIGIGGSFGRGVMTCRGGSDFQGPWGAPTMMRLGGGSVGLQLARLIHQS
jgi:lipid-binding SYLF domain-containing protein